MKVKLLSIKGSWREVANSANTTIHMEAGDKEPSSQFQEEGFVNWPLKKRGKHGNRYWNKSKTRNLNCTEHVCLIVFIADGVMNINHAVITKPKYIKKNLNNTAAV